MIALAEPSPPARRATTSPRPLPLRPDREPARSGARGLGLLVGVFAFFCFLPYASITVGNRSALQAGNVLTLLMVLPALLVPWTRRAFWVVPVLLAPLCVSVVKVAASGEGDLALCYKEGIFWALSCLTVLAVQLWAAGFSLELLTGVAAATLLHAAVGAWQWFAFRDGHLPLVELYANPSFLSVQENADTIARYIRRPFGLFPEPSAMSSSLAPWVLFWAAEAGGILHLRREPARWQRRLFAAAAAGGLGLIILSQSGHAAVTLAAMAVFAAVWFVRRRATAGAYVAVVFAFAVVLPVVLWFAFDSLSNRLGGASDLGNSSWEDRSTSLVLGLQLWLQDVPTLVLGTGVGMTSPALQRSAHLEAVWSVLLTYVYETGFVGLIAMAVVGQHLLRAWRANGFGLAFAATFAVWLVGVTVTTSYQQLLPLWLTLGWLCAWPAVCRKVGDDTDEPPAAALENDSESAGQEDVLETAKEVSPGMLARPADVAANAQAGESPSVGAPEVREFAGAIRSMQTAARRTSRWRPQS
jgi:hypothetical protein